MTRKFYLSTHRFFGGITVKDQLAAFSKVEQQVRYYRVKYYFDVNQVLTPEQRKQVQKDLAQALSE